MTEPTPGLSWRKPDDYHICTVDGRYTVARLDLGDIHEYVAWRKRAETSPPFELGSIRVPKNARDEQRLAAINALRAMCEENAAGTIHVEREEAA